MAMRIYSRIATFARQSAALLESRTSVLGETATTRHFSRGRVSDRDDDLIHEEMYDRHGDGHQQKKRKNTIRDARLCQLINEAWDDVVMSTPHLHSTLMGEHSLEKTGIQVADKGRRCTIYYTCDPASQAYVAKYFATSSRWLGHRIGEKLRVKYRPKMQFTPDGLSPDGEHLLEILSTATVDTAEPANTTSTNAGHDRVKQHSSAIADADTGGEDGPKSGTRRRRRPS